MAAVAGKAAAKRILAFLEAEGKAGKDVTDSTENRTENTEAAPTGGV